jgi:pyruvate formate lyase activating enzyme
MRGARWVTSAQGCPARFYRQLADDLVLCELCPQGCQIAPGRVGICGVRENRQGRLWSRNYGTYAAEAVDPVEKKPLYHFFPGCSIYSFGAGGCNLACRFCQNWELSQNALPARALSPAEMVARVLAWQKHDPDCIGIAYTYSEPLVWFEHVYETAALAKERGLQNVLVSNGYINLQPWRELLPLLSAVNIDVKSFREDYYRRLCGGRLAPVLRAVEEAYQAGCHVEVTTLVVAGENDSPREAEQLASWLAGLDAGIPLHVSRYFPKHKAISPPTALDVLRIWQVAAAKHLHYVYLGNVAVAGAADTICPQCGAVVIRRGLTGVCSEGWQDGHCRSCGRRIQIVQEACLDE